MDGRQIKTLGQALSTFFSYRGPRLIALNAASAWAARALLGRFGLRDLAVIGGVAAWWPLQEWLAHRYLLHHKPRDEQAAESCGRAGRLARLAARFEDGVEEVARVHRAHHREPWRVELALLPDAVVERAAKINAAAWLLLVPTKRHALTGIAAYSTMALIYEWTHFLTHTSYKPRLRWMRNIRHSHRLHHFRDENNWYGFTSPLVDVLLGTAPDPAAIPRSPTAQRLHDLDD